LTTLQQDHSILVNIQQALATSAAPVRSTPEKAAAAPSPRRKTAAAAPAGKQAQASKSAAPPRKRSKKTTAKPPAAPADQPTLVDLVRDHLTGQHEPRSAAEIATALNQQHPEREIKAKIVRLTVEGLVAKNQVQRTKQGRSVFYTATETTESA
jgi:hypothetical protein